MLLRCSRKNLPGQQQLTWLSLGFQAKAKYPKLQAGLQHKAGRGLQGKRTSFAKGSLLRKFKFNFFHNPARGLHDLAFTVSEEPRGGWRGVLVLLHTASGSWFRVPATSTTKPMQYMKTYPPSSELITLLKAPRFWWLRLTQVRPYTLINNVILSQTRNIVYARSAGCACLVLASNTYQNFALVKLPSGALKLVVNSQYTANGKVELAALSYQRHTKAGFWKNWGWAPIVRGTVKNPNDHPHGGRTRSIKYPRTPWAKTAKKSRHVRLVPKLKPLAKRRRQGSVAV